MAEKKKQLTITFTKEQIVKSVKYEKYRDYLEGNLDAKKQYTISEVDSLISKVMKGGK